MGIFDRLFKRKQIKNYSEDELVFLKQLGLAPTDSRNAINQVTYYTCVKLISESIGKLDFNLFQRIEDDRIKKTDLDIYYLLSVRPNPYTTPTILLTTLMQNVLRYGNGYLYIDYRGYKPIGIYNLPSDRIKIYVDNKGILNNKRKILYEYQDYDGKSYYIEPDNLIHIKTSDTIDGLVGKSIAETLATTLSTSKHSEIYLENLYKEGLSAKAILHYTGDLDAKAEERLVNGISNFANGSKNSGKIIPLPLGMTLQPLDTKLVDVQFFEMSEMNALNIASAFGVSPTFINRYGNSSYNNTEQEGLRFLSNALQFYISQLEEEVNYKCMTRNQIKQGYYLRLNVNGILRVDVKTQAEVLTSYLANGILTPNECRGELDRNNIEGADNLLMNGAITTLDNVVKGINYDVNNADDDNVVDDNADDNNNNNNQSSDERLND